MEFDKETGVSRVVSHLENLLHHKCALSSPFPLWPQLPPSHVEIVDNMAHLVVPPLALRIGDLSEMIKANDRTTPRVRVKIRQILSALETYCAHTVHEEGKFRAAEIEKCVASEEAYMMWTFSPLGYHVIGLVTLQGLIPSDEGELTLHYQQQQGQDGTWTSESVSESTISAFESVHLVALSELSRVTVLQRTWDPPE